MQTMTDWQSITKAVAAATGARIDSASPRVVGGGCINATWRLGQGENSFFVKTNRAALLPMFEAEMAGLEEILHADAIRAPRPLCCGIAGDSAFLALEYIEFGRGGNAAELLGRQLAEMHRVTASRFGWRLDNTIGSTPQRNTETDDWIEFWRERRLGFQLALAAEHGYCGALQRRGERLMAELEHFFSGYRPLPSLLHGDLWGGNFSADGDGRPVIFDPAVYYGDREADLAMTELFGGFGGAFYAAYNEAWPLDPGYAVRKTLYNLYHILNHLNLFGSSYLGQAERVLGQLLSKLN